MPPHEAGNKPVSGNVTPTGWLCPNMRLAVSQAVAMNTSHWVAMPQYGCTKPICGDATHYWVAMPQCEAGSTMGGGWRSTAVQFRGDWAGICEPGSGKVGHWMAMPSILGWE